MNKVMLIGRLTKNPDLRYSSGNNQTAICRYTLAVARKIKTQDGVEVDFINCIAFGKSGEFAEKYFRKGLRVGISGRIHTGSYKNKDGNTVYTTDVVVEEQDFADGNQSNNNSYGSGASNNYSNDDGFMSIPDGIDDGLPFN